MHRAPGLSSERVTDMATEIHESSRTMVRLVDDLLDFSRMERGRLQLQRRQVNVSEVLGHFVESFRHQPGGERIRSELSEGSEAFVDAERLNQIVRTCFQTPCATPRTARSSSKRLGGTVT